MQVLAVGAHFDDVELGCGGSLALHSRRGDHVHVFVATHSGYSDPQQVVVRSREAAMEEGREAADILGVESLSCGDFDTNGLRLSEELVLAVRQLIERHDISIVYTHWNGDVHSDHHATALATLSAARHVPRVLMYRSNFYDSFDVFDARMFVDITDVVEIKRRAILAHRSEMERNGYRWLDHLSNQHENDGMKVGVEFAESFKVVRYLI